MSKTAGFRRPMVGTQPDYLSPGYGSSRLRSPTRPLVLLLHRESETTGPLFGADLLGPSDSDLTGQHAGEPLGARILVSGRVLDENARPVVGALVELWQANSAGRYAHAGDSHEAPLDPNFTGCGRVLTDERGGYRFTTIRPGEYPWRNHYNAWRPAHIHFSVFGPAFATRLVTQMYFPGDPLLPWDPIFNCVPDEKARARLVAQFDWECTLPGRAMGYRFDIVLRGREATPLQPAAGGRS